ncbi:MAG: D-alanyl-D-alanine carboxypeptidase family protein [Oscillospiraceae bacterium]
MGRFAALFLALLLMCGTVPARAVSTSAASAILVEAESGRVLFAQNQHEKRPIASITKLMTALLVAEHTPDFGELVTVPYEATLAEGSSLYLKAGEKLSVEELLFGLMLHSGNDAAIALAVHLCGSTARFVAAMNARAGELGMKNTHFATPNGLVDTDNYSTAYDMSLLARACGDNELVAAVMGTKTVTFGPRTFVNHNKLLWRYEGCTGMKTGYTAMAGRTLVSCATRGGQTLIAVTLHDRNDWQDHAKLLDYGFANFPRIQLARTGKLCRRVAVQGSFIPTVLVATEGDAFYPLTAADRVTARWDLPSHVTAPVTAGQRLGKLTYLLDGVPIASTNLVAATSAPDNRANAGSRWQNSLKIFGK